MVFERRLATYAHTGLVWGIAAGLSLGLAVSGLHDLYSERGHEMFYQAFC